MLALHTHACTHMHICVHTHTLAPRDITTEMVGVEVSIELESVNINFTIEFVSKVDSTFATVVFFCAKMDWF